VRTAQFKIFHKTFSSSQLLATLAAMITERIYNFSKAWHLFQHIR